MAPSFHDAALRGPLPGRREETRRHRWLVLGRSPLARRIIFFNLASLGAMLVAALLLSPVRGALVDQRSHSLGTEARILAAFLEAGTVADALDLVEPGLAVTITSRDGKLLARREGEVPARSWLGWRPGGDPGWIRQSADVPGGGRVELRLPLAEIDALVAQDRERLLQIFLAAFLLSVGLSLTLASMIARPLTDLADAAESGRETAPPRMAARFSIPDLAARPDEIGRLSSAMRGMVSALYDRIDANEQFAADVAHEIKNPLASLRSAIDTLRIVREDQRETLLEIIDHDVQRLDRLVTDISNASRLDSELVKEEEEEFDLVKTLRRLADHMGRQAEGAGVRFVSDLPSAPIVISGLEARLAQVFVNLISNAISFSEPGDSVRLWARKRDNRVLVVVEDTGPGIPDTALARIFKRFYSERPAGQFGNHSGLGLAISKQIVEAHGGVIWAENIRPTEADPGSEPMGARFVVGLPV
ncbi:sensor histidine kinase [Falsirhodobacter xinxiangensis]|uniref:sensor histidine kinase n=1 Tax=Falsirhodobacter xinxiangensis TaxID=2530049 RepID=UPI0010AA8640|nr:ATP-binding protein [Rhodobacter xinxiangensis]